MNAPYFALASGSGTGAGIRPPCSECQLTKSPRFLSVSAEVRQRISHTRDGCFGCHPNACLVEAGQVGGAVFVLQTGWAARYVALSGGRRQIVDFVLPGEMIGQEALFFGQASHTVETITRATLCLFSPAGIRRLLVSSPDFAEMMLASSVGYVRCLEQRLVSLGRKNARERLAALLLNLFARATASDPEAACHFPLTQRHLADASGLTVVHVNATIKQLQSEGLILIADKTLRIKDLDRLTALAQMSVDRLPKTLLL